MESYFAKFYQDSPSVVFGAITLLLGIVVSLILFISFKQNPVDNADLSKGLQREEADQTPQLDDDFQVLNPAKFRSFSVLEVFEVSHNTKLIRFEIPFGKPLGLPIGRHISVRADINGIKVIRAYTPTSKPDQGGFFDILVKSYEFGKLSSYLHTLKVGDSIEVRGPVGRFKYEKNMYKCIGLVGGGTGLTPCLQVIRCVLDGPSDDNTNFVLFFQNRYENDILLRKELDLLQSGHPERLTIFYFLSNSNTTQEFGKLNPQEIRGYISQDMINQYMSPDKCPLVCICGPSGFNESMKNLLENCNHTEKSIYVW